VKLLGNQQRPEANHAAVAALQASLAPIASPDHGEMSISEAASESDKPSTLELFEELIRRTPGAPARDKISEAASEIGPTKSKRGRPKVFDKLCNDPGYPVGSGMTEAKSGRGKQEAEYAYIACRALFKHHETYPEVLWATGAGKSANGRLVPGWLLTPKAWKAGVLAELGRIICKQPDGEQVALGLVIDLVNMVPRPTAKQATAWIRRQRVQVKSIGSAEGVFTVVLRAIDDYMARYPDTPDEMVAEGVSSAAGFLAHAGEDAVTRP
jgi:hypothetical protein